MGSRGGTPPTSRRIYLKGVGSQAGRQLGSFVWKNPTLNRRKAPTIYQTYAQQTMAVAARFVTLANAWEYEVSKEIAGNSGFTWKDQMIAGFFGTGIEFTDVNGVQWIGRRILAAEIQQLLDSISATPGSVLVRTANGWAALYGGSANQLLTIDPVTGLPNWLPAPGVAPAAQAQDLMDYIDVTSSGAFPASNLRLRATMVRKNIPITGIGFIANAAVATAVIYPCIYDLSTFTPAARLASGPAVTGVVKGVNTFPFSTPWTPTLDKLIAHGFQQDTASINIVLNGVTVQRYIASRTGAPPSSAPSMTTATITSGTWFIY